MIMKNRYLFYILILFLLASCGQKQNNENSSMVNSYEFSLASGSEELLENVSVEFQTLELTEKSIVGSIDQIVEYGDTLFISDGSEYRLLAFTKTGKFIGQIGSRGEGPGEYSGIASFFIDADKSQIGIYDEDVCKMLYYNLSDFSFIDEKSYEDIVAGCCLPDGDSLIWYNQAFEGENSDSYFIVTDPAGKVTSSFVKKDFKTGYLTGCSTPMYICDGKIYGYTPYETTVYELSDDASKAVFKLKFKEFETPSIEYLNKISSSCQSSSLYKSLKDSGFISYYSVSNTTNTLCTTVMAKGEKYCGLAELSSGKTYFTTQEEMANKLGLGNIRYFIVGSIGESVLAIIDPMEVKDRVSSGMQLNESLRSIVETSDDNANPIIAKIAFCNL